MKNIHLLAVLLLITLSGSAQTDTLRLTIREAESLFLKNNYQLLAANYQIGQAQAGVISARLFDNPELSYENLFYNHETRRFLETSYATGQYNAELSQLIKLAGKRKKNIQLAQTGIRMAENDYFDLIRTLKFQLKTTFYKCYYAAQSVNVFQQEITSTEQLLKVYQEQLKLGNIASKDVIRVQSLLISLKADLNTLLNELDDDQKDLKILCGIGSAIQLLPEADPDTSDRTLLSKIPYTSLLDSALANRGDLKLAQAGLELSRNNLQLQKAMAVPDMELSLSYDLKGNYPEKYTGLGIRIPIPMFNRNQGEIKKAKIGIDMADAAVNTAHLQIENEVYNTYRTALRNEQQYEAIDQSFNISFRNLMDGVTQRFRERSISLIEFLDFYQSYKESALQLNRLRYDQAYSREEINYVTGSLIFK